MRPPAVWYGGKLKLRKEREMAECIWGLSCAGCEELRREKDGRGRDMFRCGAAGPMQGRVVGIRACDPYIPAWCPIKNENERI